MKVSVLVNKSDASKRLAFIRHNFPHGISSVPAYFPKDLPVDILPSEGSEVEVMISGVLYRHDDKSRISSVKCLFIREPTDEDIKVRLEGFQTWGSQCFTDSKAVSMDGKKTVYHTVTPGRLMSSLPDFYEGSPEPMVSLTGWIRKNPTNNKMRLEGVEDINSLRF